MINRELRFVDFDNGRFIFRKRIVSPRIIGTGVILDSRDPLEGWCNFPKGYSPDNNERFLTYERIAEERGFSKINASKLGEIMGSLGYLEKRDISSETYVMKEIMDEILRQKPVNSNAYSLGVNCSTNLRDYYRAVLFLNLSESLFKKLKSKEGIK